MELGSNPVASSEILGKSTLNASNSSFVKQDANINCLIRVIRGQNKIKSQISLALVKSTIHSGYNYY